MLAFVCFWMDITLAAMSYTPDSHDVTTTNTSLVTKPFISLSIDSAATSVTPKPPAMHNAFVTSSIDPDSGQSVISNFIKHFNATTHEIDLVFVIDRSGSVPAGGWGAIENFVMDVLQHFTVDANNTRVAIVTFSSDATVDINDLEQADKENKCTLHSRIKELFGRHTPYGYTSTYAALDMTYKILENARTTSKKAVIVLTDGRSNLGPPPVRAAFRIMALQWSLDWNADLYGPQVEIYAFGIEDAYMPELRSIASALPNHTYLAPTFTAFAEFARSLHGGT